MTTNENLKLKIKELNKKIKDKKAILSELNAQIDELKPTQGKYNTLKKEYDELLSASDELQNSINDLQINFDELNNKVIDLKEDEKKLNSNISVKTKESNSLNAEVANLKDKLGLYSKDLEGVLTQSNTNRDIYSIAIGVTFIVALIFIIYLICLMRSENLLPKSFIKMLNNNTNLIFWESILIRASILGALIFIILIFINLMRGFISQYIRNREKISSITVLDFMVSRLGNKNFEMNEEEEKVYAREVLKEQIKMMSEHLPEIIKDTSSNFDKISKTDMPTDKLKDILQKILDKYGIQ